MRVLILIAALVVGGLGGGIAFADDREDRETARREFAAGQAADRRKAYQEAIEHYMRANDLVPHPFAMFNIAVDFEKLGKLREAANWYERYLDHSSTKEADREKVNRLLVKLRNQPSQVSVVSTPDGGRVIINGVPVGTTPYRTELKGGFYNVIVQKGNERDSKEFTVEYGEPVNVQFAFSNTVTTTPATTVSTNPTTADIRKPAPPRGASGVLVVRGDPYGALVAVDGVPIGTLPMQVPLEVGTHAIRITADGYTPYEQNVQITSGARVPVDARLPRALGTLNATTEGGAGAKPIRVGYLIGGGGGADARGAGALYLGEFGIRASKYDLSARVGKIDDVILVDLMARWTLTSSWIAPFIGGGYSYVSGGYGYLFCGGLRVDFVDNEKGGISLMAESGFRYYSGTVTSTSSSTEEPVEGSIVPIMASLLIRYR